MTSSLLNPFSFEGATRLNSAGIFALLSGKTRQPNLI
jgi:hypothetical protein